MVDRCGWGSIHLFNPRGTYHGVRTSAASVMRGVPTLARMIEVSDNGAAESE
jgi:hypothetical protein